MKNDIHSPLLKEPMAPRATKLRRAIERSQAARFSQMRASAEYTIVSGVIVVSALGYVAQKDLEAWVTMSWTGTSVNYVSIVCSIRWVISFAWNRTQTQRSWSSRAHVYTLAYIYEYFSMCKRIPKLSIRRQVENLRQSFYSQSSAAPTWAWCKRCAAHPTCGGELSVRRNRQILTWGISWLRTAINGRTHAWADGAFNLQSELNKRADGRMEVFAWA